MGAASTARYIKTASTRATNSEAVPSGSVAPRARSSLTAFSSKLLTWDCLRIVLVSAGSLALGGAGLLLAARRLGLSAQRATGGFAGFVGQPAVLGYANSLVNDERIDSAYGALFALGTVVKILLVQLIALA